MSHYKPYPAYKDSGVEWIGMVPEHWARTSIKYVLSIPISDGPHETPDFVDEGVEFLSVDGIQDGELVFDGKRFITHEDHARFSKKAKPQLNDVLVGKSASVGKVARVKTSAEFNVWSPLAILRADHGKCHPAYLEYALKADTSQQQILLAGNTSTQANIGMDRLAAVGIPLPPIEEQCELTLALDRETTRIDALITKKDEFIELLAKKRQALITHAVTKGLDPKAKMKDSGVEWIGEVPEHWTISKLKYVSRALIGLTYAPEDVVTDGSGITVLRSSNIQGGQLDMADIVQVRKVIGSELMAQVGDILICSRNGSRALIGKNIQLDERSLCCTFGAFMTVVRGKFNDYLYFVFNSTMFDANSALYMTSTVNQLTISMIDNMEIPLPPETEQATIVSQLRKQLMSLDTLVSKTQLSIALLKKRRSALITAAVTGQIDLRESA